MKRTSILIPICILLAWLAATGYALASANAMTFESTDALPTLVAPVVNIEAGGSHS